MLIIGLTGGIGSGKTTVAEYFSALGIPIIDADIITRELTQPHQPALQQITKIFGNKILDDNGGLDRQQLRALIFSDEKKRKQLESILHPKVYEEIQRKILTFEDIDYCIVVIPLLVETGGNAIVDRILVVDSPESLQRQRVIERDHTNDSEIDTIIASQASRKHRTQLADDIIVNDKDLGELQAQIQQLHNTYVELAKQS